MGEQANWYQFEAVEGIDTPALLIYRDRVISNIEKLKQLIDDVNTIRPHVKTNKSAQVSRLMIDAGITKFKCATVAEAEMLGQAGAADVLLAYQPSRAKLERLIKLMAAYPNTKYACLTDNEISANMMSEAALEHGIRLSVCIDINVGMDRTGIPAANALSLYERITALPALEFKGLHAYDGHIEDQNFEDRVTHCQQDFAALEQLRHTIGQTLGALPLLIAGGSPTCTIHAKKPNTECSPGTFVFWDKNYHDHIAEQDFDYAAAVLTRVVSLPGETKVCVDMGYKAISCEKPLDARAHFLTEIPLTPLGHSEEHLVLEAPRGHNLKVGDLLFVVPKHICPTVAMYNRASIIDNGKLVAQWPIDARGREITV